MLILLGFALTHTQTDKQLDHALDLMRRLPPQQIERNLGHLLDLVNSVDLNGSI